MVKSSTKSQDFQLDMFAKSGPVGSPAEGPGVTEGYTGTKWEPVGTLAEGSVAS